MAAPMTSITVYVSDDMLENPTNYDLFNLLRLAILAQRPVKHKAKKGDIYKHSAGYTWRLEVLGIYGKYAWCKHSAEPKPCEWTTEELERHLNSGLWVLA